MENLIRIAIRIRITNTIRIKIRIRVTIKIRQQLCLHVVLYSNNSYLIPTCFVVLINITKTIQIRNVKKVWWVYAIDRTIAHRNLLSFLHLRSNNDEFRLIGSRAIKTKLQKHNACITERVKYFFSILS